MSPLTLPGTIPGLLRRGSPVILATRTYGGSVFLDAARGVVCSDGGRVATETLGGSPVLVSTGAGDLALDLSDPTGRAHAAWWLAGRLYPNGERIVSADVIPGVTIGPTGFGLATCDVMDGQRWRESPAFECTEHLNPNDPRLLPDGSRWVDAEALRLVCLHVAGLTP